MAFGWPLHSGVAWKEILCEQASECRAENAHESVHRSQRWRGASAGLGMCLDRDPPCGYRACCNPVAVCSRLVVGIPDDGRLCRCTIPARHDIDVDGPANALVYAPRLIGPNHRGLECAPALSSAHSIPSSPFAPTSASHSNTNSTFATY